MEQELTYTLIRSKRKTMSLAVNPDGSLCVRAPMQTPVFAIDAFVQRHREWVVRAREKVSAQAAANPPLTEAQIALLKAQAKVVLPQKVAFYAAQMGLSPKGVQITSAQKRFGSCGSNGKLHFSYRLMLYPEAAVDYVVVHELAHMVHFDHSRMFYQLVGKILPDYKQRAALLSARTPKY